MCSVLKHFQVTKSVHDRSPTYSCQPANVLLLPGNEENKIIKYKTFHAKKCQIMSYPGEGGGILFFGSWYLHTSSIFETILLFTFIYNHELCQNKMSYYQEKNCFIILNSMTVLGAFCDAQDPVPSIELPMLTVSVGTGVLMIFSIEGHVSIL